MESLRPPKPECHAELEACLDEARESESPDAGANATPPSDPPAPPAAGDRGPRRKPREESAAERACHAEARECLEAERDATPEPEQRCPPARKPPRDEDGGRPKPPHRPGERGALDAGVSVTAP
jgi:hypothetical protein